MTTAIVITATGVAVALVLVLAAAGFVLGARCFNSAVEGWLAR